MKIGKDIGNASLKCDIDEYFYILSLMWFEMHLFSHLKQPSVKNFVHSFFYFSLEQHFGEVC